MLQKVTYQLLFNDAMLFLITILITKFKLVKQNSLLLNFIDLIF